MLSSLEPEQHTDEQVNCGLLSKLPYDVRLIIYEMVLGGNVLHLSAQSPKNRILYNICKHPDKIDQTGIHQDCSSISVLRPSSAPRDDYEEATGLLPLLVTCRRIYSEAISSLYSNNTFEFNQIFAAFTFLKVMIPQQRLQRIRHFRLHLRIPRHPLVNSRATRDWRDLWTFFGTEMPGLQTLYVQLLMLQPMEAHIESTQDNEAETWIRPMVLMAFDAFRKRGCKVQIETRNKRHEPANILVEKIREHPDVGSEKALSLACATLHEKIRISLG